MPKQSTYLPCELCYAKILNGLDVAATAHACDRKRDKFLSALTTGCLQKLSHNLCRSLCAKLVDKALRKRDRIFFNCDHTKTIVIEINN